MIKEFEQPSSTGEMCACVCLMGSNNLSACVYVCVFMRERAAISDSYLTLYMRHTVM